MLYLIATSWSDNDLGFKQIKGTEKGDQNNYIASCSIKAPFQENCYPHKYWALSLVFPGIFVVGIIF